MPSAVLLERLYIMADTSLQPRRPLLDHPFAVLILVTITLSLLAAFTTLRVLDARAGAGDCEITLGQFRLEMAQSGPPSVFDTSAWEALTERYNQVFTVCPTDVAAAFTTDEFDPWAAPALVVMGTRPDSLPLETDVPSAPTPSAPTEQPSDN